MLPLNFFSNEGVEKSLEDLIQDSKTSFASISCEKIEHELTKQGEDVFLNWWLTDIEKARYRQFRYKKRKVEWLAGRCAAKTAALKVRWTPRQKEQAPWQFEVQQETTGRPFFSMKQGGMDLSISHSNNVAVALVTAVGRCGIDIQKITPTLEKVESRFICSAEKSLLYDTLLGKFDSLESLALVWAAKETLRKGGDFLPVLGFLECTLVGVEKESGGIRFLFRSERGEQDGSINRFTTHQNVCEDMVIACMIKK